MLIKILFIVGGVIITFSLVIFIIATIRVLKQSQVKVVGTGRSIDSVGTGEQVIAVLTRNGNKEFIK